MSGMSPWDDDPVPPWEQEPDESERIVVEFFVPNSLMHDPNIPPEGVAEMLAPEIAEALAAEIEKARS